VRTKDLCVDIVCVARDQFSEVHESRSAVTGALRSGPWSNGP